MAKIREIDVAKDAVEKYSTEELVAFLAKSMKNIMGRCNDAIVDSSFERLCMEMPILLTNATILSLLNEKLNGQKGPNLL